MTKPIPPIFPIIDVAQYGGKQVAVVDGVIIAAEKTLEEVIAKARKQVPTRPLHDIKILFVPPTLSVIYYVAGISVRHYASRRRQRRIISCR